MLTSTVGLHVLQIGGLNAVTKQGGGHMLGKAVPGNKGQVEQV